jgi:cobalt/nickel transport protein
VARLPLVGRRRQLSCNDWVRVAAAAIAVGNWDLRAPSPSCGSSTEPAMLYLSRLSTLFVLALAAVPASAHFQELIPSTDNVTQASGPVVGLDLSFTHPMERGPVMDMGEPVRFGVLGPGGLQDLKPLLQPVERDGKRAYRAEYRVRAPGDYVFYCEPAPYWEGAEGLMIVHYAKVVVDAYGGGEGWDSELGLPAEIAPLTRPYGLWTGNLFRGVVKRKGVPVPDALVEVEWRNDGSVVPSSDAFVTQVIKTDANGVFAYAIPRAGWWGFAALLEGEPMSGPGGGPVPVELGALIWVQARDMK